MFGAAQLNDGTVAAAVEGQRPAVDKVAEAMMDQVRLMVMARLSPDPGQATTVDELTQATMTALTTGLHRVDNRTVAGLKAYTSTIVARRVADHLRDPDGAGRGRRGPTSLDSTFGHASEAGPLWQFLSASGTSPLSAAGRADQLQRALTELSHLQAQYREVIAMAFFDQLTTSQIAERLGKTRPAAAMLLMRAIKTLRRNITGSSEVSIRE